MTARRASTLTKDALFAAAVVTVATLASMLLRDTLAPTNLAMIYLGGLVAIAMRCRRWVSVTASFLSVAAFDFFCVPPYLTFAVSDYQYVFTFAGMLIGNDFVNVFDVAAVSVMVIVSVVPLYVICTTNTSLL